MSFLHLKHLHLGGVSEFDGAVHTPRHLPALEALPIDAFGEPTEDGSVRGPILDELDVSACQRLQYLVLVDVYVLHLLLPPTCRLTLDLEDLSSDLQELLVIPMRGVFGLTEHMYMAMSYECLALKTHFFDSAPQLKRLKFFGRSHQGMMLRETTSSVTVTVSMLCPGS